MTSTETLSIVLKRVKNVWLLDKSTEKPKYKWDIVWHNIIFLIIMHVGAFYGFYLRCYSMSFQCYLFVKAYGIISSLGVTAGAHRLWAHRTYKANALCQILLATMMSMTYQNSIYIWSRDHRMHHKYSETDADPHNAKRGFFFSHVGWLMIRKHKEVIEKGKSIDMSDLEANPIVMFQHKYYFPIVLLGLVIIPIFVSCYIFGESLENAFFVAFVYRWTVSVNLTWCINSLAHLYGSKPYDKNIGPTENGIMKLWGWGEGFHNYHHTFPWDYKAAELGPDVRNFTTSLIDFFAWLGWVTERKTVKHSMIESKAEKTGDGSTRSHDAIYSTIQCIIILCLL